MAILPPASSDLIPPAYRELMTSPTSPIIDFYPLEFEEEEEPGRPKWANIALLNFIDEKRLLDTLKPLEATLTEAQAQRNRCVLLFFLALFGFFDLLLGDNVGTHGERFLDRLHTSP
jgi:5'-3' exonuclease